MSIICQQSPYYLLFAKGSPESILDRSTHTLINDRYVELTEIDRQTICTQNDRLASQGLRALGFAYRYFPHLPAADTAESELIWVGLVGMLDTIGLMKWAFDRTHTVDYPGDPDTWKTIVFTTLCIAQMGHALAVRSVNQLVIKLNPFGNPLLLYAIVGTILLQLAVVYIPLLRWRSLPKVIVFWDSSLEFI